MTITEDFTLLDHIANEPLPSKRDQRNRIIDAIAIVAHQHQGRVHWSWVRPLLSDVDASRKGSIMSALASSGVLVKIPGEALPSGDRANRNGARLLPVYQLASWDALLREHRP